jgi:hypothetical protein
VPLFTVRVSVRVTPPVNCAPETTSPTVVLGVSVIPLELVPSVQVAVPFPGPPRNTRTCRRLGPSW